MTPSIQCDPAEPADQGPHEEPMAEEAFEALFRAHFNFVYRNLARLGVPPSAVEDAAQEVFVVVLRRGESAESMRGWIFGIVRRIAWRYRRGSARRVRLEHALTMTAPPPTDGPAAVAEREARVLLDGFLERLDEDKRAVFLLAELEQMTGPEIAKALCVKENTVYSRLRAARQAFDRTFSRMRRAEHRALREGPYEDDRTLRLSQARRAHEPKPETRQRAWVALFGAPKGAATAAAGAATAGAATTGAEGGASTASTWGAGKATAAAAIGAPAKAGLAGSIGLAAGGGAKLIVAAVVGLASVLLVASKRPTESTSGPASAGAIASLEAELAPPRSAPDGEAPAVEPKPARSEEGEPAAPGPDSSGPFAALARAKARREASREGRPSTSADGSTASPRGGPARVPPSSTVQRPRVARPDAEDHGSSGGHGLAAVTKLDDDALRREFEIMRRAREEIRAHAWSRAKLLLERHARHFPEGALAEERRLSLVSVLCALGDTVAAKAEIATIRALDPAGSVAERATATCPDLS